MVYRQRTLRLDQLGEILSLDVLYGESQQVARLYGECAAPTTLAWWSMAAERISRWKRSTAPGRSTRALLTTLSTSRRSMSLFLAR